MALEVLLFGLTVRLYLERIVILSSIISFIWIALEWPDQDQVIWVVLYVFTTLHHLASLLQPLRFFYGIFDFIFLVIESIGVIYYALSIPLVASWAPEIFTIHVVFVWMDLGTLLFLVILRLATIIRSHGKALIQPYNVLLDQSPLDEKPIFFRMCMGRSIWKAQFVGETKAIIITRGLLGLVFLVIIAFWILSSMIFEPMKETALSPVREFRAMTPPSDFVDKIDPPVWNVIIPFKFDGISEFSLDTFKTIMSVTPAWGIQVDPTYNVCPLSTSSNIPGYINYVFYQFICPATLVDNAYFLPSLNVIADFSLLEPAQFIDTVNNYTYLPVVIGMTNSTDNIKHIMQSATPMVMLPQVSTVASIVPTIRQVFTHRGLAALGIFQLSTTFWDPRITATYPDPLWDSSGTLESSLRLLYQLDWSGTRIIQDYRQHSVVSGFADIGGLWAALSGIFAIIFGASMMHIVYGAKPLSIFGLAHSFQYQHMKDETLKLYPNIIKEHKARENRGLLALLHDNLIDLSFLDKELHAEQRPGTNFDVERPQAEKEIELPILAIREGTKPLAG